MTEISMTVPNGHDPLPPAVQSIAPRFVDHPISRVEWVDVNLLDANDYNPNHVMEPEMALLALSMTKQKWIQPILVWPNEVSGRLEIIDGFHRHLVVKRNKQVWGMTGGLVPVVRMPMPVAERMLLTIRINRAKGNHTAVKMHEIVAALVNEHLMEPREIATEIGADRSEIETLMAENVFELKKVDETNYSKSWFPKTVVEHGMDFQREEAHGHQR